MRKPIRDALLKPVIIAAWLGAMSVLKIRWWFSGERVLPVSVASGACDPSPRWLDEAMDTSVQRFVARRMSNRLRKQRGANWEILYEDDAFVYYGCPRDVFGAGGLRAFSVYGVTAWSRVRRANLAGAFPGYRTLEGVTIDRIVQRHLEGNRQPRQRWEARLEAAALVVVLTEDGDRPSRSLRLDPCDGTIQSFQDS